MLLVKTSSMGDVIHMLSAVQEAALALPAVRFDWVCEETFVDLPRLSPAVDRVIPVATRRWRHRLSAADTRAEIGRFITELRSVPYDLVIDAQGLLKTAWITALARCPRRSRWGLDWSSSREPLSTLATGRRVHAPPQWHAIERLRTLMAQALGFFPSGAIATLQSPSANCLSDQEQNASVTVARSVMFLHGTSREQKAWPAAQWVTLGKALAAQGLQVLLPSGSAQESRIAADIAAAIGPAARVLPSGSIGALVPLMRESVLAVGVDSGLMHLAVVLGVPTVAVMSASHLERFSAARFAPSWAPHAQVVTRSDPHVPISAEQVLKSCRALGAV